MSPYNSLLDYQRYASYLVYSATAPPAIRVSPDGDNISYNEYTLNIPKWRSGLEALYKQLRVELTTVLHGLAVDIKIPDIVPDDWANLDRGYSWLNNGAFVADKRALIGQYLHDPELNVAAIDRQGQLQFNTSAMRRIMAAADASTKTISILAGTSNGQGARIKEFVEHKISNGSRGRTIFRDNKDLWAVIRRAKFETKIRREVFLPSKINPRLQEALEIYLLIIRPLQIDFARKLWGPQVARMYEEYLFVIGQNLLTSDAYGSNLQEFTEKHCGQAIGIQPYRHITVEITRVYLGSEYEMDLEEDDDILARQRVHCKRTANHIYAPEHGKLSCLSSDVLLRFGRASEAWWEVVGFMPGKPPMLPLAHRRHLRGPGAVMQTGEIQTGPTVLDHSAIIQALTATVVSELAKIKGDLFTEVRASVTESVAEALRRGLFSAPPVPFLPVDRGMVDWRAGGHSFNSQEIAVVSTPQIRPTDAQGHNSGPAHRHAPSDPVSTSKTPPQLGDIHDNLDLQDVYTDRPYSQPASASNGQSGLGLHTSSVDMHGPTTSGAFPEDNMMDVDNFVLSPRALQAELGSNKGKAHQLLCRFFPEIPNPQFTSPQQQRMVETALEGQVSFLGILPTGGGKSLVYLLPCLCEEDSLTVVIEANKSLLQDQLRNAQERGLTAREWKHSNRHTPVDKGLLYLALETAVGQSFKE